MGLPSVIRRGNHVYVGEARSKDRIVRRWTDCSTTLAKPKRTVLIEGVHQAFAHAIIDDAESGANTGFAFAAEQRAEKPGRVVQETTRARARGPKL